MNDDARRIWRPREVLSRYGAGERGFRGIAIEDPPGEALFRSASLTGADFSGSYVVADFTGADLRFASFRGANVKTCCFDAANLEGADFSDALLDGATFEGTDLAGTSFAGASVHCHVYSGDERPPAGPRRP